MSSTVTESDALRFGLDQSLSDYQSGLQAAQAFNSLRRDLDRSQTTLATLTRSNFKRRNVLAEQFGRNVGKLCSDGDHELLPLLGRFRPEHPVRSLHWLILACYSLTPTAATVIKTHELAEVFAELFPRAIGDFSVFPETKEHMITIITRECERHDTTASRAIYSLLPLRPVKRPRLMDDRAGTGHLILSSEALALPEPNPSDTAPDLNPSRSVFQLHEARGDKLDGIWPALLQATKTGHQWCWERQGNATNAEEMRTDCVVAMIPVDEQGDISFVFRVGYTAGWEIVQYLDFRSL